MKLDVLLAKQCINLNVHNVRVSRHERREIKSDKLMMLRWATKGTATIVKFKCTKIIKFKIKILNVLKVRLILISLCFWIHDSIATYYFVCVSYL